MNSKDFILSGGSVVTANEQWDVFDTGAVVISGENIVEVGPANEIKEKYSNLLKSVNSQTTLKKCDEILDSNNLKEYSINELRYLKFLRYLSLILNF